MIIDEIVVNKVYEQSYAMGYAASYSRQLQLYTKILSIATEDQVIEIAKNKRSAVVRFYAFQALKEKKTKIEEHAFGNSTG